MKREVNAGVNFIKRLAVAHGKLDEAKADAFGEKLQKILLDKYHGHWYPESPSRGQAYRYCLWVCRHLQCVTETPTHPWWNTNILFFNRSLHRCIRMNRGAVCGLVQKACEESELTPNELRLPDVTLWIDPLEVCARWVTGCCPWREAMIDSDRWVIMWRHLSTEPKHKCCIICCILQLSATWKSQECELCTRDNRPLLFAGLERTAGPSW